MNDRYLFKAKQTNWQKLKKEEQVWIHGSLFQSATSEKTYIISRIMPENFHDGMNITDALAYEVDTSTLCQCTGLRDKSESLIWENDIVNDCIFRGTIKYGEFESNILKNIGFSIDWVKAYYRQDLGYWFDKIEVIGNIFDNPELLEAE